MYYTNIQNYTVKPPWATTSHKWAPLLSQHLTKILIGSSASQIAISETSHKQKFP